MTKITENYSQYNERYLRNACGIVTYLNILKYRYAIFIVPSFLMKLAITLENLGLFSSTSGAVFDILYKGITILINRKLGLNFKVVVNTIPKLKESDKRTYGLGIKGYSTYKYNKISEDKIISKEDIDYLAGFTGGIGHNVGYDGSAGGYIIDTNGTKPYKFPLENLKYGYEKGLFYTNIRTIEPNDKETEEVVKLTVEMFKYEKKGRLNLFYNKHSENLYLEKSKKLYFYGR